MNIIMDTNVIEIRYKWSILLYKCIFRNLFQTGKQFLYWAENSHLCTALFVLEKQNLCQKAKVFRSLCCFLRQKHRLFVKLAKKHMFFITETHALLASIAKLSVLRRVEKDMLWRITTRKNCTRFWVHTWRKLWSELRTVLLSRYLHHICLVRRFFSSELLPLFFCRTWNFQYNEGTFLPQSHLMVVSARVYIYSVYLATISVLFDINTENDRLHCMGRNIFTVKHLGHLT